jgi:hypothetical protein
MIRERMVDLFTQSESQNARAMSLQTFQKVLRAYATKLGNRLPKTTGSLMAAATGTDWQVKVGQATAT